MKFNIFDTFEEACEAEQYDHFFQKALGFATATGIDFNLIRENQLHIEVDGVLPLDNYITNNEIILEFPEIYELAKRHWAVTTNWAEKKKFGDKFVYRKDHSDRTYNIVEIECDDPSLKILDKDGNEIISFCLDS